MTQSEFASAIATVLDELLDGVPGESGRVLNSKDLGLLRSLESLTAEAASAVPPGGRASIAAHADHLRYGLSLLNKWSTGVAPFADADYSASWKRITVTDGEWAARRSELRHEANVWREAMRTARDPIPSDWPSVIASVVHLAYHLGAIRQLNQSIRGPAEQG